MKVITVGIHEAKMTLSQLVKEAGAGNEVVISSGWKPVARLVAYEKRKPRVPGLLAGQIVIKPGFDLVPEGLDVFHD